MNYVENTLNTKRTKSQEAVLQALRSPSLPKQFVEAFWRTNWQNGVLEEAILEREDLSEDILQDALVSPRVEVRCALARNQRLSPHHLDVLSHDIQPAVRAALNLNPHYKRFLEERKPKHLTRVKMEIDGEVRASTTMRISYSPVAFGIMKDSLWLVPQRQWKGEGAGYYFVTKNDVCIIVFAYTSFPGDSDEFSREFFGVDYNNKIALLEQIAENNP